MAIIPSETLKDVEELFDRYTRTLPWPWAGGRASSAGALAEWNPRVDIVETDGAYEIQADIPGVRKEDLKVTIDQGVLTVQGERQQEKKEDSARMHRVERFYGQFSRSFTLPEDADTSGLQATAKDGQLTVTVPRKGPAPSAEPTQVPIQ
ncbi:Hsp20/alpha crystallin family protein [Cyanobium sp. AMD-g]|uniref:Hsp20/alpha crystallin family protein n=1 Tax=Cyanobium sp. AMD-g TaxID=2823699 RepID=UPI0020CF5F8F|nr:Hsp20/alpha crystallin family protein [Cyanobium sp. AMD-g]MCP9929934.1 Hsp20/alpha crystallin family protein [Cyanobium sp. AMD-g]